MPYRFSGLMRYYSAEEHCLMGKHDAFSAAVRVVVFAAVLWPVNAPADADELITLKTRPGVTQPMLLWQPGATDPHVVLLVFPGAGGNVGFERKGDRIEATGTYLFLHHRDLLVRPELVVAVIDAPSDQPDMDSEFRRSAKHVEDMTAVVRELKERYPKARLVLLGHSRGTVSAAYVAQALGDRVAGVVLMAGFYERDPWRGVGLSEFDFDALKTPVLIVHHIKDMCPSTLFGPAQKLSERLPAIIVDGSEEAESDQPCVPGTNHWFDGKEKETLDQVLNWIYGRAWTRLIR